MKKLERLFLERFTITQRLVFIYVMVVIVIVSVIAFALLSAVKSESRNRILKEAESTIQYDVEGIELRAVTLERMAQLVVQNGELREFLYDAHEMSLPEIMDFRFSTYQDLVKLSYNNPDINSVTVYYDSKEGTELWPIIKDKRELNFNSYYKALLKKGRRLYEINDDTVGLYVAITGFENDYIGVAEIKMKKELFFRQMFLTNPDIKSQIVFTDSTVVMNQPESLEKETIETIREKIKEGHTSFYTLNKGVTYLTVVEPSTYLDWDVVNLVSLERLSKEYETVKTIVMAIGISMIFIVYVWTAYGTKRVLRNLYKITDSVKAIRAGNKETKIEIDVSADDEFGDLAQGYQHLIEKVELLIEDVTQKRTAANEAQLRALQNQIDAHFLFNVLENIKMLAEIEEQYMISDSMTALGDMLRYNLNWKTDFVSVKDELQQVRNYVYLMNVRHDQQIVLQTEVEEKDYHLQILKMSIQPLVENAIQHGGTTVLQKRKLHITLSLKEYDDSYCLTVRDDGCGMDESTLLKVRETMKESAGETKRHIGLRNINERLHLFYKNRYSIQIESEKGIGTTCTICVKKKE